MTPQITIIDYGLGNLLSLRAAFEHCGAKVELTSEPEKLKRADRLLLPGVGAFSAAMDNLRTKGLVDPIFEFVATEHPLLGVCLGMQLLFDRSEEFGHHNGLALIPGGVKSIPHHRIDGTPLRVPHVGWNEMEYPDHGCSDGAILNNIAAQKSVYFVHSYHAEPRNKEHVLSFCRYGGHKINAIVQFNNIVGCQFHPEKSGETGLNIIRNFLAI